MRRALLYGGCVLAALVAGLVVFPAFTRATALVQSTVKPFNAAGLRSLEVVPLETVSETSSNASIGDLNGDGHPDIVLVKGRHWQVTSRVFSGDGTGHFTPGPALPSNAIKSYSASLADMTRSGRLDMVLSNDEPDPKLVLVNDGKGHFTIGGRYGDPKWSTRNAAVGDLNGDGHPDIAVANRQMTSFVCFNDGKLHFDCRPLEDSPSAATVTIADMNGDGANDVIYACRDSCQSVVYVNGGKGSFARKEPWGPPTSSTRAMAVADVDGDGHADIAACPEELGCFVYLNDGKGTFRNGIQFQTPRAVPYSMIAADLNGDHRPEILVGYVEAPGVVYFNDGTGKKYQPVPFGDGKGAIYGMAAGDLNGDGWPDVVVARSDAPCFVMFNRSPNQSAPAPVVIANKLDTPEARVYVATLLPHAPSRSPNGHATNRVLVYLDDGVMTRQEGSDTQTIAFHRGDVRWRPASGAYVAENTSDHPIRILEIDLKGRPAAPAPVSPLDPTVVDNRHYTIAFENDQIRVLRVHYDAQDTGALHQHILNRVVVYLNDQPGAKADDVRMSGPGTHTERNASDQPADRIAVELK